MKYQVNALARYAIVGLAIFLSLFSLHAEASSPFAGGSGTIDEPYMIDTAEQLDQVRAYTEDPNVYFELSDDIDLSSYTHWRPIGSDLNDPMAEPKRFSGHFDGKGHMIRNMVIHVPNNDPMSCMRPFIGLFATSEGTLQNIRMENIDIQGCSSSHIGGLTGENHGTIYNASVTGKIEGGEARIGGLVGVNQGTIEDSSADVYIRPKSSNNHGVGGLVGYAKAGSIVASYATGHVENAFEAGGLVGILGTRDEAGDIIQSYALGDMVNSAASGGLVGIINSGTVEQSYATGDVEGAYHLGGLVSENHGTIVESYAIGHIDVVSTHEEAGGLVAINEGDVIHSFWNTDTTGVTESAGGIGKSTPEMIARQAYDEADWDSTVWQWFGGRYPKLAAIEADDSLDLVALEPTVNISGGVYSSEQTVALSGESEASIYYTLDETEPSPLSTVYTDPITFSTTTTLKAMQVDAAGNKSDVLTEVYTIDTEPPVMTLNGPPLVQIERGESYTDEGATAFDLLDGDVTDDIFVDNPVDEEVIGTYDITYKVSDKAGHEASLTREVHVLPVRVDVEGSFGAEQSITVRGAEENAELTLYDAAGDDIATATVDAKGDFVFVNVPFGSGYTVTQLVCGMESFPSHAVSVLPSSNANLVDLTVSESELTPSFSPAIDAYQVRVNHDVEDVTVVAELEDKAGSIAINGEETSEKEVRLNVGENDIAIVVTAQDGTVKTYTIQVTRELSNNANLATLQTNKGTLAPSFDPGTKHYTVGLDHKENEITIIAEAFESEATVSIGGRTEDEHTTKVLVGENTIPIIVTAPNGERTTYVVTVIREEAPNDHDDASEGDKDRERDRDEAEDHQSTEESKHTSMAYIYAGEEDDERIAFDVVRENKAGRIQDQVTVHYDLIEEAIDQADGQSVDTITLDLVQTNEASADDTLFHLTDRAVKTFVEQAIGVRVRMEEATLSIPVEILKEEPSDEGMTWMVTEGIDEETEQVLSELTNNGQRLSSSVRIEGDHVAGMTVTLSFQNVESVKDVYALIEEDKKEARLIQARVENEDALTSITTEIEQPSTVTAVHNPPVHFTDIDGHWAEADIKALVRQQAISGYLDDRFHPDRPMTRAEFISTIVKALGMEDKRVGPSEFKDVQGHWAEKAIAVADRAGFITGKDGQTFAPDEPITREQMAVMLVRGLRLEPMEIALSFSDRNEISSWAQSAVATAAAHKVVTGYPDDTFKPQKTATRAEAVVIILEMIAE
ncbi:DUF5011 domain-containing protein [Bacillaceae bacterium SIJ1]|uniref:S-layer homology domain-containing protein n=1 Tax=Litoribacterium kuwaitense TaxID=1398745 RepID=UPI0013EBC3B3|nr:S-layer homology domain-containing protein [Litoribacterium kuwaitense]NGP44619.1 DUF5011 domain-containing protein [Litoribacterium kuwaitense]